MSFLKKLLKFEPLLNPTALLNVALIILGGSLEDEVFERKDIFFNSLIEYLDIKYELKSEIDEFNLNLAKYVIGILKGYSLQLDDTKVDVTNIYWNMLDVIDFSQISKIFNKITINTDDCPPVRNARYLLDSLCKKNEVAAALAMLFTSQKEE